MTLSYNLVHSAESTADQSTVTGLYLYDSDSLKSYILEIPTSVTISEGKVTDELTITEVDASTLAIVSADVPLEEKTVRSSTVGDVTVTPAEGKIGFSSVVVKKFDGESGSPDADYADGDEVLIQIPYKYMNLVNRVPEFSGRYKAVISDNNTSYAYAQVVYADNTQGPRLPLYDLIGKVDIELISNN